MRIYNWKLFHNRTIVGVIIVLLFMAATAYAKVVTDVSGSVISGYRILSVLPGKSDNLFTVYRGDYIKSSYPQKYHALTFSLKDLQYTETVRPNPDQSPFYKMKNVGDFTFQLGTGGGVITVIELVRPNYIEVTAGEAFALLKNIKPFILDVRTQREYQQIHIEGSVLIPIQELQKRLSELQSQKYEDLFVYCATGNRSTVAAKIIADAGFERIYNLRKGVYDWARNGYPYVSGN